MENEFVWVCCTNFWTLEFEIELLSTSLIVPIRKTSIQNDFWRSSMIDGIVSDGCCQWSINIDRHAIRSIYRREGVTILRVKQRSVKRTTVSLSAIDGSTMRIAKIRKLAIESSLRSLFVVNIVWIPIVLERSVTWMLSDRIDINRHLSMTSSSSLSDDRSASI